MTTNRPQRKNNKIKLLLSSLRNDTTSLQFLPPLGVAIPPTVSLSSRFVLMIADTPQVALWPDPQCESSEKAIRPIRGARESRRDHPAGLSPEKNKINHQENKKKKNSFSRRRNLFTCYLKKNRTLARLGARSCYWVVGCCEARLFLVEKHR